MTIKAIPWDGKVITRPGTYSRVPLAVYHSAGICDGPSVSSSGLRKLFAESPAHFYASWPGNPAYKAPADKKHFIIGRAVHFLVLGEPYFAKFFCIQPPEYPDKKTGELKPWSNNSDFAKKWNAARDREGRSILTDKDVVNIKGMAQSLGRNPMVRGGALNGSIERSIFWKDKETGIWLKARPDNIPDDSEDFVDLKTTISVKWTELCRAIGDYNYHAQGALICRAAREVLGFKSPSFTLVFVEKTDPWCTRVVTVKPSELERGEKQNRMALDTMADCLKSGRWPGPGGGREDAEDIELPEYAQKQIDDRLRYGIPT